MPIASSAHFIADALRVLVIAGSLAVLFVHLSDLVDAIRHAAPRNIRIGLALRWLGHSMITVTLISVVAVRLGTPLNWYTPTIGLSYITMMVSMWLLRGRDPITEAAPEAHRE